VAFVKKKSEACSQVAPLCRISSIIHMWWEPGWRSQYRDKLWTEWCRVKLLDLGHIQLLVQWVPGFFSGVIWQGMKLTIYLHFRLRLRMSGAIYFLCVPSGSGQGQLYLRLFICRLN
jgi:hypothetical protein